MLHSEWLMIQDWLSSLTASVPHKRKGTIKTGSWRWLLSQLNIFSIGIQNHHCWVETAERPGTQINGWQAWKSSTGRLNSAAGRPIGCDQSAERLIYLFFGLISSRWWIIFFIGDFGHAMHIVILSENLSNDVCVCACLGVHEREGETATVAVAFTLTILCL